MSVPLRDFFAAHAAAALVSRGIEPATAAKQAYDVADALMEEREFRAEASWLAAPPPSEEADFSSEEMPDSERFDRPHLLDEPLPPFDDEENAETAAVFDPRWEDLADPSWDREPRWSDLPPAYNRVGDAPPSPKPGLARTQPTQVELPLALDPPKKRSQSA